MKRPYCLRGPHSPIINWYRVAVPRVQQLGRDVDLSPPSSAKVKNEWIVPVLTMVVLYADGDYCTP
jgi:hypothetical protein